MTQNIKDADYWIEILELQPHPEGGYFRETFVADDVISTELLGRYHNETRKVYTLIYYLLKSGQVSKFHRLKSDEIWTFHIGSTLTIHVITKEGEYITKKLGANVEENESFQHSVKHGSWFGASVDLPDTFALVGCFVAPGFDFKDFEMGDKKHLLALCPKHHHILNKLTG